MNFLFFIEIYAFLKVVSERKFRHDKWGGGSLLLKMDKFIAYLIITSCKFISCSAYCFDLFLTNFPGKGMSSSSSFGNGLDRLKSLTSNVTFSVSITLLFVTFSVSLMLFCPFSVSKTCSWLIFSYFSVSLEFEFVF